MSFSSVVIGLVAGVAIGFFTALTMQNRASDSVPSMSANNAIGQTANSSSQANAQTRPLLVNSPTSQSSLNKQAQSSEGADANKLDVGQLSSRKKFADGFSGELSLMNQIGQADFDELQNLAIGLLQEPEQPMTNNALQLIGLRMAELDADETINFLFNHFSSPTRSVYEIHSMIEVLAGTHYLELITWTDTLSDKQAAFVVRSQVLTGLARVNPEEALALYAEMDTGQHGEILYSLLHGWSEVDPQSAMTWALDQTRDGSTQLPMDGHAAEIVFSQWLMSDYSSAEAFLQNVGDEKLKAQLQIALINRMSVQDPQMAIELALGMEDNQSRMQAFESALFGWSSTAFMDAVDYATHSLSGEEQDLAFHIIGVNAGNSHAGQLGVSAYETMLMTESMPQVLGERIRISNMYNFFEEDSQAAMQWLDTLADPIEREQLIGTVAYDIARTDLTLAQTLFDQSGETIQAMLGNGIATELHNNSPESAWSWYEQLPAGEVKTSVLHSMIFNESQTNPDKAMELVLSHQGVEGEDMLFSVFANAAGADQQWARNWLDQADISPDKAVQLRSVLEDFRLNSYGRYEY